MRIIRNRRTAAFLLAVMLCITSIMPVSAAEVSQDGVTVTMNIDGDKTVYDMDENIPATITVQNKNYYAVTDISLEGLVPEGYSMNILNGTAPMDSLAAGATETYQVEFVPDPSLYMEQGVRLFEADFEEEQPFSVSNGENYKISWIDTSDEDHGKVIEFERITDDKATFYMEAMGVGSSRVSNIVYEFDVNLLNVDTTYFRLMLRANETWFTPVRVNNGTVQASGTTDLMNLCSLNQGWHTIAVAYDYAKNSFDVYVDGVLMEAEEELRVNDLDGMDISGSNVQRMRFYVNASSGLDHFYIDNVRVYEGTQPYAGELKEPEKTEIVIDYNKTIFDREKLDTSEFPGMLEGYVSLHTRNGMVYQGSQEGQDGTWTKLNTMPVETEDGFFVVAEEICNALNISYEASDSNVIINAQSAEITVIDGTNYINAKYFFETILGKTVSIETEANSYGVMIAGASAFDFPSAELFDPGAVSNYRSALQNFNDYLFFENPTYNEITSAYDASSLKEQHPRIMATKEDFDRIREDVKSNEYMSRWYQQLLIEADVLVEDNTTPLKWELRDGMSLLPVAEDAMNNMYVLGMAYQLTGDEKYAERAWTDLEAISYFKNWYTQPLDTATFCVAAAIGYDWMYDAFTDTQRQLVEEAVYYNAYTLACSEYMGDYGLVDRTVVSYNQCAIINCGLAMAALAFMDVYPEVGTYITSNAIKAASINLTEFAPDGAYREGAGYWAYVMTYVVKLLSTIETVFGTCYSLDLCEGLSTSASYMLNVQSDMGIFNYNDARQTVYYVPEYFYLSQKYNDPSIASTVLYMYDGKLAGDSSACDLVSSMLYFDTDVVVDEESLPEFDKAYYGEGLVTMRDRWSDELTTFVGVHGGYNHIVHGQLDAGTFVYDYAGVRWIKELGKTPYQTDVTSDYNSDGGRWKLFRSKAEAHNTIVIVNGDWTENGVDQVVDAGAQLTDFKEKAKGAIAVLDMSDVYEGLGASAAKRGFFFTDDRSSVVVRDEITLTEENSTVYSFFLTDTEVTLAEDGTSAILTHENGKQMKLEFTTTGTGTATLGVGPATRALLGTTSPVNHPVNEDENFWDVEDESVNRIYVKLTEASGEVAITVKLTPTDVSGSTITEYNVPISEWIIPDGEIAAKPEVQSVIIDGREMKFGADKQAAFLSVVGRYDTIPEALVTVDASKYTYEVTNADSTDGGIATIVVRDKNDPDTFSIYTVKFIEIPEPKSFEGMTSIQVVNVEASDEPQGASNGYYRWCVLDNDTNSRWTAQGGGNWILLELEEETAVDNLMIAFYNPTKKERGTYFGINVSTDGENWELVWSGTSDKSASNGDYQLYDYLGGKAAKYIRLDCNGNTSQGITAGWNNIAEIVVTRNSTESDIMPTPTPTLAPTATPALTPSAAPTSAPTLMPSATPVLAPTATPTLAATSTPDVTPTPTEISDNDDGENGEEAKDQVETTENPDTGDDGNIFLWSKMTVLACIIALAIGIIYRRKSKSILSVLLVCALLSGMFANVLPAKATDAEGKNIEVTQEVTVGESTLSFGIKVNYTIPNEYDTLISAYGNALYSEDFNSCIEGASVEDNKPEGTYYYYAKDSAYGGTVTFEGGNGYIQMLDAYGQMVYVKLTDNGISGVSGMKYLVVESKLQYNTSGIEFKFMTRGANDSNNAKIETLGVLKDGVFGKEDGTEIASITVGEWHTFTYVFDITNKKYDLYIDGEKKQDNATCSYFRGFNGDDQFRLKAASLTEVVSEADIMIDDIKVYGSTTDPTSVLTEEVTYDSLITAYGTVLYSEDFNDCENDTTVQDNKPDGTYYYYANDGTDRTTGELKYGGTVKYVHGNGYILMDEAYGQMIYVQLKDTDISGVSGMKYLVLESKLQYNIPGIAFKFMTLTKVNNKSKIETFGVLNNSEFKDMNSTKVADITAEEWHTFTYAFDIANKQYDLYIDGEKKQTDVSYQYFSGFNSSAQFRLKAYIPDGETTIATGADIMIDDIKVYGSTTDPTAIIE